MTPAHSPSRERWNPCLLKFYRVPLESGLRCYSNLLNFPSLVTSHSPPLLMVEIIFT
jgi:hypothetical protein